jgi:hypothetical protein
VNNNLVSGGLVWYVRKGVGDAGEEMIVGF